MSRWVWGYSWWWEQWRRGTWGRRDHARTRRGHRWQWVARAHVQIPIMWRRWQCPQTKTKGCLGGWDGWARDRGWGGGAGWQREKEDYVSPALYFALIRLCKQQTNILVIRRWTYWAVGSVCGGGLCHGVGHSLVVDINAVVFMLHRWWRVCVPRHVITRLGIIASSVGRHWRDGVVWEVRPG